MFFIFQTKNRKLYYKVADCINSKFRQNCDLWAWQTFWYKHEIDFYSFLNPLTTFLTIKLCGSLKKSKKWKNILKIIIHNSCLLSCILTKLSQIVCLINTYILIYRYARCDYKLWSAPWFYCVFGYFHKLLMTIHVWIIVSSSKFYWLCVWLMNVHILEYQHAKCDCRLWIRLHFLWIYIYYYMFDML